jgi:hypothetical protein
VVWSDDPVTISADEPLAAAAKKVKSGASDFLQEVLRDGPVDHTEIVRLGEKAGYSEKALRTARDKLGVKPSKKGFGADGKWEWGLPGGAKLKLVVDKNPSDNKRPLESADGAGDDMDQDQGRDGNSTPGQDEPGGIPKGPDGDDVA